RGRVVAAGRRLVVTAAVFVPRLRAIDDRIAALGPELALLRRVSFLRPLPFAIAEHLASELESATYDAGDVIIREGEPGERFYMIAEGRTRAAKDGTQLREMSTGDSFGEIALLRRIPRTATVTAVSRVTVRFLVRQEFLAAVTGSPESVDCAEGSYQPGSKPADHATWRCLGFRRRPDRQLRDRRQIGPQIRHRIGSYQGDRFLGTCLP